MNIFFKVVEVKNIIIFNMDTRRQDRRKAKAKHFQSGKHVPRTMKDQLKSRNTDDNVSNNIIGRSQRRDWGYETLEIFDDPEFNLPNDYLDKVEYHPEETKMELKLNGKLAEHPTETKFILSDIVSFIWNIPPNQTKQWVALNFASAKNPGGGFLKGSRGQEEALAMSSGLYLSLQTKEAKQMYAKNESRILTMKGNDGVYRSDLIYSSNVPFIRKGNGELIEDLTKCQLLSIITAPAVNYGHFSSKKKFFKQEKYEITMMDRIDRVFKTALNNGHTKIILGPWGCGVFGGDLKKTINWFKTNPNYKYFEKVVFLSTSESNLKEMEDYFIY